MTLAVFIATLGLYVIAGAVVSRLVKSSNDFFVMSEMASTVLIVGTLAATYLSAVTLLGIAGISYSEGPLVIAATGSFGAWIGTMLAVLYVGRKLKALGCHTMPDFFRDRFQNKAVTITATIIMIVGLLGYGVIQLVGAGLILGDITGIPFQYIIVAFVAALLIFSALGGMYSVVFTDTLMFLSMLAVSLIIAPMLISQSGFDDMRAISEKLPGFWTISGAAQRPFSFSISQFIVWVIFFTCTPALVSRVFPAKNDFVLLKAGLIGVFLVSFMQIPVFLAAASMQTIEPGIEPVDRVMIVAFLDHMPPALGGVGLAALMAAIMSTASTLFVLAGFGLSRDLYETIFPKPRSDKRRLANARIAQVIVSIAVATIAITQPAGIYWMSVFAGAIFGVGWLPTIVASLEWKRMNARAALVSMSIGVASFIALQAAVSKNWLVMPLYMDPLVAASALGVLSLIAVGLLTSATEYERDFYNAMKKKSPSVSTIQTLLKKSDGATLLRREYKQVVQLIVVLPGLSALIWGWLFLMLKN